jgi:hypothetical protein
MKKIALPLVVILAVCIGLISCSSDSNDDPSNGKLKLAKSEITGCYSSGLKLIMISDTLFYTTENDTLKLQGSIILSCGSGLQKTDSIVDNTISIYLQDTSDVHADCICSYGVYYCFTHFENKTLYFNVYYKAKEDVAYSLWRSVRYPMYMED